MRIRSPGAYALPKKRHLTLVHRDGLDQQNISDDRRRTGVGDPKGYARHTGDHSVGLETDSKRRVGLGGYIESNRRYDGGGGRAGLSKRRAGKGEENRYEKK